MEELNFENSSLKRRILAECGSISNFAHAMGITHQAVLQFISGKRDWNRAKILKACEILHVNIQEEMTDLFFSPKSSHFTTK